MRQINKRKSNLTTYVQGLHKNMRPIESLVAEAFMSSRGKEKGFWVWDVKGEGDNLQEDDKE